MRSATMIAAAVSAVVAGSAQAAQTASDVAAAWTSPASCYGAPMANADEAGTVYNMNLDGGLRVAQVQVRIAGDKMSIIDDQKVEYYRILGPNRVEYVGYDIRASGPATRSQTSSWQTCG